MKMSSKENLLRIIKTFRSYGHRLTDGLKETQLFWQPPGIPSRTIASYLCHIVDAEIYWLKRMGYNKFHYTPKNSTFDEVMTLYDEIGVFLSELLDILPLTELIPKKPVFDGKNQIERGSLAWMIERTTLHAVHHLGQIAHIRYSLNNPPLNEPLSSAPELHVSWGEAMDTLIFSFVQTQDGNAQ
jgi:uncharacterized damage-inducible protein DinB